MKTNSPFDASFERSMDAYGAWLYADPGVHSACVAWFMLHQFNLAVFDNFLQEDGWNISAKAQENRDLLIQRRAEALRAFKAGNKDLAFAWINFLYAAMRANKRENFLLPLSRTGKKFVSGRKKNAIGPVRAEVRKVLKRYPEANTLKVWNVLSAKPPEGMEFNDNNLGKYIGIDNHGYTSYRQLANIVSSERRRALPK